MPNIALYQTQDMINDYHASLAEFKTCQRLLTLLEADVRSEQGRNPVRGSMARQEMAKTRRHIRHLQERLSGNEQILRAIRRELERRQAPQLDDLPEIPQVVEIRWGFREGRDG